MFKLDGSETSWLVYADWLEDRGIDATCIRSFEDNVNQWHHEFLDRLRVCKVGSGVNWGTIGGWVGNGGLGFGGLITTGGGWVGDICGSHVGTI